jgi:acyl-CoA thioester hydrolase
MPGTVPTSCDLNIRVRYAESDPMGYLHHAKYFEYFEMGRTELLRQVGFRYRDLEERGFFFVVAKMECRFLAPARYDDDLILTTRVDRMTRARIDHAYEVRRGDTIVCQAKTTLACVGRDGKLIQVPGEFFDEA